jgi:hypothetical protein
MLDVFVFAAFTMKKFILIILPAPLNAKPI